RGRALANRRCENSVGNVANKLSGRGSDLAIRQSLRPARAHESNHRHRGLLRAPPRAAKPLRRRARLRIFVVRCSLPCDPPVGGHSCNGGMIPRFHRAVCGYFTAPRAAQTLRKFGLLRARRERPRSCAAEQRDERPALHSITSSARASRLSGTVRPSTLAVVKLITRSNLVGCSTGMSAGFAPRRILST